MKLKACAVFLLVSIALAAQALAFDGKRKGFILGGGVGGSFLMSPEADASFFPTANFKIGHATSESFEIYYLNSVSGLSSPYATYLVDTSFLSVTKYMKPEGKGLFLFAGVGISVMNYLVLGGVGLPTGLGLIGGVGYDIGRHWSIQGDIVYTGINAAMVSNVSGRVTINFLAF